MPIGTRSSSGQLLSGKTLRWKDIIPTTRDPSVDPSGRQRSIIVKHCRDCGQEFHCYTNNTLLCDNCRRANKSACSKKCLAKRMEQKPVVAMPFKCQTCGRPQPRPTDACSTSCRNIRYAYKNAPAKEKTSDANI